MQNNQLKNHNYAEELCYHGAVKIPFLTTYELNEVRSFYDEIHEGKEPPSLYNGIHMTMWHSELEYKLKIYERLKEIFEEACERTFKEYRAISHQFVVKLPGNETDFPVHQDWSIVDETKYQSINMWLALQDVDESNGAMWVVRGSHNIDRKVRGAGYLFPDYTGILEEIKPIMTQFPLKAGEAVLFYHRTLHGSPRNLTNLPRVAAQLSIIPKEAPLQVYFQKSAGDKLEVHRPEDNFAFSYNKIREDSSVIPPTAKAFDLMESYSVEPVRIEEVRSVVIS